MAKWLPGQSGNKLGRPPGTKNRPTQLREILGDEAGVEAAHKLLEMAMAGDMTALIAIVKAYYPFRKGAPHKFPLPDISCAADLPVAMGALISYMADGEISSEEAANYASVLETARRSIETTLIEERLAAVEQAISPKPLTAIPVRRRPPPVLNGADTYEVVNG